MGYKNWKKNYHAVRKGRNWANEGFMGSSWYTFRRTWAETQADVGKRVGNYVRKSGKWRTGFSLGDTLWKGRKYTIPGLDTPIIDLTLEEATSLEEKVAEIDRKKLLSAGGYRHGRKTHGKHTFNKRMRRDIKRHNKLVMDGYQDEADNLFVFKDRRFWWIID